MFPTALGGVTFRLFKGCHPLSIFARDGVPLEKLIFESVLDGVIMLEFVSTILDYLFIC